MSTEQGERLYVGNSPTPEGNIILGRVCRFAYLPIVSSVSGLIHQKLHRVIEEMEREGYNFQRLPSASQKNEGWGLLKDIFMKTYSMEEKDAEEACKHYELWRFFTDDEVEDSAWKHKLSHFMAEINMLQPEERVARN